MVAAFGLFEVVWEAMLLEAIDELAIRRGQAVGGATRNVELGDRPFGTLHALVEVAADGRAESGDDAEARRVFEGGADRDAATHRDTADRARLLRGDRA